MLYLPFKGRIIEWKSHIDDVEEELAIEDGNCFILSERRPPSIVIPHSYSPARWKRDKGVKAVRQVWIVTGDDEVYRDDMNGEYLNEGERKVLLYDDHEQLLTDVAEHYEPYRVLLELRQKSPKGGKPLARKILTGNTENLQTLIDILEEADDERAEVLSRVL